MQGSVNNTHKGLDLEEDQDAGNSAFSGGYKSFAEEIDPSPKPFTNPFAVEQSSPQPDQKVQAGLINQVQEAMTRDVSQTQILNTSQNLVASVSTGTVQNNSDTMKDGIKAAQQLQILENVGSTKAQSMARLLGHIK